MKENYLPVLSGNGVLRQFMKFSSNFVQKKNRIINKNFIDIRKGTCYNFSIKNRILCLFLVAFVKVMHA